MDSSWRHKLRAARQRAGVSQREVAERAEISAESIRAYETGRRRPTRERLAAILQAPATVIRSVGCNAVWTADSRELVSSFPGK